MCMHGCISTAIALHSYTHCQLSFLLQLLCSAVYNLIPLSIIVYTLVLPIYSPVAMITTYGICCRVILFVQKHVVFSFIFGHNIVYLHLLHKTFGFVKHWLEGKMVDEHMIYYA